MDQLLAAIVSMLLVLALIPLYLWKRRSISGEERQQEEVCRIIYLCCFKSELEFGDLFFSFYCQFYMLINSIFSLVQPCGFLAQGLILKFWETLVCQLDSFFPN